ncbi:PilW family protein [Synechococcus sp. CBW1006]|uniref:PilW family protein n=1 Tax=Synechococcus sp. CBW1006 TaxID=1353138 RepID=UPI0018CF3D70|nr:type II secretion system protein [Synechococcus sp. CBW1006]QPN65681.1 type II secretion system protein [Synechococcus sp. CBW1006]
MATLHSLSRRTDAFAYDQKVQPVESDGFTLIEILVGAVLLAIVAGMAGSLVMVSNRSLTQSEALANAGSAIDKNISEIRQIAERFTCVRRQRKLAQMRHEIWPPSASH